MTDLREIITPDVERVMRERGDWPKALTFCNMHGCWSYERRAPCPERVEADAEFMLGGLWTMLAWHNERHIGTAATTKLEALVLWYMQCHAPDLYGDKNDG